MRSMCRRQFVATFAAAVPILARPRALFAATEGTRALNFLHTHTGETLSVEYAQGSRYLPDALATVNQFLRDFRTGDVHAIDQRLLDLLHGLTRLTETHRPFQVISGLPLAEDQRDAAQPQRGRGRPQPAHAGAGHRHPPR